MSWRSIRIGHNLWIYSRIRLEVNTAGSLCVWDACGFKKTFSTVWWSCLIGTLHASYVSRRGRISMVFCWWGFFFFPPDTHLGVKPLGNVRSHQVRYPGGVAGWEITHIFWVMWESACLFLFFFFLLAFPLSFSHHNSRKEWNNIRTISKGSGLTQLYMKR